MIPRDARVVRLRAPASLPLPDLLGVVDRVVSDEAVRWSTSHVDTDDLVLLRWGVRLRRRGDDWSLRLPPAPGIPDARLEHHWTSSAPTPPAAALALLTAVTRGRPVARVARVDTRRVTRHLLLADGARVADLHDDEVSVFHGRRLAERFRELVLVAGDDADVDVLTCVRDPLVAAGAETQDPVERWARILGPDALAPPDVPVPTAPGPTTAGQVVAAAVADATRRLVLADPHARLGVDPEGVHQARVATRRLRSDLRTFRPLLDEAWVLDVRAELARVADALGAVRDVDVLTDRLARAVVDLPAADQHHAHGLGQRLELQRETARRALAAVLDGARYVDLLDLLVAAASQPPLRPDVDGPADQVLPGLVTHPWKRLRERVRALDDDPDDTALHDIRIRAKRLRYAAEAVTPQVGKRARRLARAAARVQTVLGDHHDACVAEAWLRDAATELADPAQVFVAGLLAGRERAHADALARRWADEWARLDRKKVRGWL